MANPFNPAEIKQRAVTADEATKAAVDYIPKYNEGQQNLLGERLKRAQNRRGELDAMTGSLDNQTRDLATQAQGAAADLADANARRSEVAKMPFFKRLVAQTFHPGKYGDEELARDTDAATRQLAGIDQQRERAVGDFRNQLFSKSTKWEAEDQVSEAEGAVQTGTLEALVRSSAGAAQVFESGVKAITGVDSASSALLSTADTVVKGLSPAQRGAYLSQAGSAASIDINGTAVPVGVLSAHVNNDTQVDLAIAGARMARKSQELQLGNQFEDNALAKMSYEALRVAAANGGVYNGHQFDETKVNVALANRGEAKAMGAAEMGNSTAAGRLSTLVVSQGRQGSAVVNRYASALGQSPSPAVQAAILNWRQVTEEIGRVRVSQKDSLTGNQESTLTTKAQAAYQAVSDAIEAEVGKGFISPGLKALTTAYVFGRPASADVVASATVEAVTKGLDGKQLRFDRYSSAALESGKVALRGYLDSIAKANNLNPSQVTMESLQQGKIKYNKEEMNRVVLDAVTKSYGRGLGGEFEQGQARFAKIAGAEYGRITDQQHTGALRDSQTDAINSLAKALGVGADEAKSILQLKDGETNPVWAATAAAREKLSKEGVDLLSPTKARGFVAANQSQAFLRNIDRYAAPGFTPSKAYTDWLHSPEFEQQGAKTLAGQRYSNTGGFAMDTLAGGAVANQFGAMRDGYFMAHDRHQKDLRNLDGDTYGIYQGDNRTRFNATLHNIPGLTPAQATALVKATEGILPQDTQNPRAIAQGIARPDFSQAFTAIANAKFADPALEAARKIAVKNLAETQQRTDRMMAAVRNGSNN